MSYEGGGDGGDSGSDSGGYDGGSSGYGGDGSGEGNGGYSATNKTLQRRRYTNTAVRSYEDIQVAAPTLLSQGQQ